MGGVGIVVLLPSFAPSCSFVLGNDYLQSLQTRLGRGVEKTHDSEELATVAQWSCSVEDFASPR